MVKSYGEQLVSRLNYLLQEIYDVVQHQVLSDFELCVAKAGERNEGRVRYAFGAFSDT